MLDSYLIDGYNLIHALGMIHKDAGPGGLKAARKQLLTFLRQSFGDNALHITVVFDAAHAPRGALRDQIINQMNVRFAPKGQSADDVIETLIGEHGSPKSLVVVSNDARLENAARRRGARSWSHEKLLDFFEMKKAAPAKPGTNPVDQKDEPSAEEAKAWQKEFADVENDPDLKEFFDHDSFD
jgi:uncharacterized protein